ncbi:MAG: hypothetical protein K5675_11100, partial [Lachnospiraceae bacterium]|nr:hypothetical protein [Lachnospiraceae bacterium]
MAENFEHYISKNIKAYYRRRIFSPALYLILLFVLSLIFPLKNMAFPSQINEGTSLSKLYNNKEYFVDVTLHDLYFTGYKKDWLGINVGYFYYTMYEDDCIIVLLRPSTCQQGNPEISELTIRGQILPNAASESMLLENLAEDLSWTSSGIKKTISSIMLSEPDGNGIQVNLFRYILILTSLYALGSILVYLLY